MAKKSPAVPLAPMTLVAHPASEVFEFGVWGLGFSGLVFMALGFRIRGLGLRVFEFGS